MVLRFFLLASVFFFASCVSVDRSNPDDPNGDNYQSERKSSSSNSASVKNYCVYAELKQCYFGLYSACPGVGGVLADKCPYSSSSSAASGGSSQSQSGKSSSSAAERYAYCVFISEEMCLTGPLTNCPPGGTLSNSCPYESSSSSVAPSSSGTKTSSSSSRSSSSNAVQSSSSVAQSSSSSNALPSSSSIPQSSSSVAQSSSSAAVLSSSSKPSSSSVAQSSSSSSSIAITYTPTCEVPATGKAGVAIAAPTITCNGSNGTSVSISSGFKLANAPNWTFPAAGTYDNISVSVLSGNCGGKTAACSGILTVVPDPVIYGDEPYDFVMIGTQIWMSRNLNYEVEGSKCYGDDGSNCAAYGKLYDWATAMALPPSCNTSMCGSQIGTKHKGICPDGWHIPSNAEWTTLSNSVKATELRSVFGWKTSNIVGTDNYGFSALPGGGSGYGVSGDVGERAYWWSASQDYYNPDRQAYYQSIDYNSNSTTNSRWYKDSFFSVRCLKD